MKWILFDTKTVNHKRRKRRRKRPKTSNTLSDLSSDSNTDYEEESESEIGKTHSWMIKFTRGS